MTSYTSIGRLHDCQVAGAQGTRIQRDGNPSIAQPLRICVHLQYPVAQSHLSRPPPLPSTQSLPASLPIIITRHHDCASCRTKRVSNLAFPRAASPPTSRCAAVVASNVCLSSTRKPQDASDANTSPKASTKIVDMIITACGTPKSRLEHHATCHHLWPIGLRVLNGVRTKSRMQLFLPREANQGFAIPVGIWHRHRYPAASRYARFVK